MRTLWRILAYIFGGLVVLVLLLVAYIYISSSNTLNRTFAVEVQPISISSDVDTIERGKHLVTAINKCADCHGENLGGSVFLDIPPAYIRTPNLTSGANGIGTTMTDEDWIRAIRYGIGKDGKGLVIMPSEEYHTMDDADLASVIAYIKSLPPVDSEPATTELRFLGRALVAFGQFDVIGAEKITMTPPPAAPPAGATVEYGRYLSTIGGCMGCHNPSLSGGTLPGAEEGDPVASNLTPGGELQVWSEEDFFRALREGKRPGDIPIDPAMPWQATKLMTDEEIRATLAFLRSLPAKQYGEQ